MMSLRTQNERGNVRCGYCCTKARLAAAAICRAGDPAWVGYPITRGPPATIASRLCTTDLCEVFWDVAKMRDPMIVIRWQVRSPVRAFRPDT